MNLEQIKEKYGNVKLKFDGFSFTGKTEDGEEVYASVEGSADDIYNLNLSAEKEETINSLRPNSIKVLKDGKKIVDWNCWGLPSHLLFC